MKQYCFFALAILTAVSTGVLSSPPQPSFVTAQESMVVMKVLPQYGNLLPQGTARSCGIASLDMVLESAGVIDVERLHPHAKIRDDLPRLDLVVELRPTLGIDPESVVKALRHRPEIEWIETMRIPLPCDVPDDPLYGSQPHLPQVLGPEAWDVQKGDSSIVIAIVDNGTDYAHPDLWANVFTNELEAAGVAGFDDDGNGRIDDVHGYDVADNDADPSPCPPDPAGWFDHGTLVAGAAAAVTNNGLGVAGISWNCEYMPVKASHDGSPNSVSNGYQGITYAAETGADIINCSWGNFGAPSQYSQDVIDYATGLGSLVLAAAGNDAVGQPHWPSAYLNTISVTWVTGSDRRAGDATWGRTVDISAPGVNIRSTRPGGAYGAASGSSLASPVAAGIAGLIKSGRPELGVYELGRQLVLTADNIDDLNPGFEGLLGIGRVNAYRAVTEVELHEQPYVETWAWTVSDSPPGGNGDGWIIQGESGQIWVTYRSYTVSPAENATVSLGTSAPGISIIDGTINEGDIPADAMGLLSQPFTFAVASDAPSQRAMFLVTYEAAGGFWQQDTLAISIGQAPILLVDDDDGDVNVEEYYLTVFDSLDVPYLLWDYAANGAPDSSTLLNFPVVVWACEWAFPSLTPEDRAALGAYLDHGGRLYLSGQDIGWDLCDPGSQNTSPEAVAWFNDYLHAAYIDDNSQVQSVEGVPGDLLGDGMAFGIYQPGRDPDNQYPSVLDPYGDDSYAVFRYTPSMDAAVRYREEHGVVYTAFGFEAVASGQNINPVDHTGTRTELMMRILDYLGPIMHTPLYDTEDTSIPISVWAHMTSPGVPDSLWLVWTKNPELSWTHLPMVDQGEGMYHGTIPAPGEVSDIWYYLEARGGDFVWRLPLRDTFRFHVGPDLVPPSLNALTELPEVIALELPRVVEVMARDNLGLDLESGMLYYEAGDIQGQTPLLFQEWIGTEARLAGSLDPVGAYGDTVYYYCSIQDTAQAPNTGHSLMGSYVYGLEGFEHGLDSWDPGTGWDVQTGGSPYSGDWIVTDSPGGAYGNNEDNALTLLVGLDLGNSQSARLSFWVKYGLQENHDFCHVEASRDGQTWTELLSFTGRELSWTRMEISLGDMVGEEADSVLIRFRLVSDEEGVDAGVYLDNVFVESDPSASFGSPQGLPDRPVLCVSPVPSTGEVTFFIHGHEGCARVQIYDISGRLVSTVIGEENQPVLHWNGRGSGGRKLPSGVYLARLTGSSAREKLVIIR